MQRHRMALLAVVSIVAAFPPTVRGQERGIDVRAHAGHTVGLDDSPPYAWVGGGAVTASTSAPTRFGLEFSYAHMFGPYSDYESRALLFTGLWEYEFNRGGRVNPYAVAGVGMTLYQDLLPSVEHYFDHSAPELAWETQKSLHFQGGLGIRLRITERLFRRTRGAHRLPCAPFDGRRRLRLPALKGRSMPSRTSKALLVFLSPLVAACDCPTGPSRIDYSATNLKMEKSASACPGARATFLMVPMRARTAGRLPGAARDAAP